MSKPVHSTFDSRAGVEEVFGVLTAPTWSATKAERFGDGAELKAREERPDGGVLVVNSRKLPDGVPGFLQRFLPADGRVLETFDWGPATDGERRGTWKVEIPGAPARLGGTSSIVPSGTGATYAIEGEVTVKVPVVGGKAETYIAGMVEKLAAKEADLVIAQVGR
jgi:hypothetical protein